MAFDDRIEGRTQADEPAANAQLEAAPPEIRIIFNEQVEGAFSQVQLFDDQGQQVDGGGSGLAAGDPTTLVLPLEPIAPGLYTVIWQTVGSDGHKVIGNFIFTVLPSAATPTSAQPAATASVAAPTPAPAVPPPSVSAAPQAPGWLATLMAWLRTALTLMAGGVALTQFTGDRPLLPAVGLGLLLLGCACGSVGFVRYRAAGRAIRRGELPPPGIGPAALTAGVVALASVLVAVYLFG